MSVPAEPFVFDAEAFRAEARALGYTEVLLREWAPGTVVDEHTHPFDAKAVVVGGELWLTVGEHTRHLGVGDRFELAAGVPHAERYGEQGARFWVARR